MRVLEGKLVASGLKVGIVAARFNEFIVFQFISRSFRRTEKT